MAGRLPFPDLSSEALPAGLMADPVARRALDYAHLLRVLMGAIFVLFFFSPIGLRYLAELPTLWVRLAALLYLILGATLWIVGRRHPDRPKLQALLGALLDVTALTTFLYSLGGLDSGVGILFVAAVAAAALLLPGKLVGLVAAFATLAVLGEYLYAVRVDGDSERSAMQAGVFGLAYFLTGFVGYRTAQQLRESEQLADQRGLDLANLSQLNALIIQRMRTGILVVDDDDQVRLMNESAWYLLGMPSERQRDFRRMAPGLFPRLTQWRAQHLHDLHAIKLAAGVPAVVPRFVKLEADARGATLVFLEDESMVSRRAEEMTLASLGRMAASIAHEVRNPLASISYSQQLLKESTALPAGDRRLVELIGNNAARVNTIIENVLLLSKRERSRPLLTDVNQWLKDFVEEYRASHDLKGNRLELQVTATPMKVSVDPTQLHQVVWNLTSNALRYGRKENQPAIVTLRTAFLQDQKGPILEVLDQGPGIPPENTQKVFQPFFTTHHEGTGLGLYLAHQLCEANQAELDYLPIATGGACFRIQFATPNPKDLK
jgi:two-component system, NtrC family, sensor histidine kinase PilS